MQASQRLDCKPRDPLEHSGEGSLEGGVEGAQTAERPPGGAPSQVKGTAGGCEGNPLGLEYTIPRRAATKKKTRNTEVRTGTHKEADAVPPFAARGLSANTDETDWQRKWEHLKH
jgi:hypothetical protein